MLAKYCALLSLTCSLFSLDQIMVIIPSYNNIRYFEKNLQSVLSQESNGLFEFTALYIDDCSIDGMSDAVQEFLASNDRDKKISYTRNSIRQGAMKNVYTAVHSCPDRTIIVNLDGDDWFAHPRVLQRIHHEYTKGAWMTWGQYETTEHTLGNCLALPDYIFEQKLIRSIRMVLSHPRTFYAKLFKYIKEEDFLYEGSFMDAACDVAMMLPMLEMAQKHHAFIPDILYIYNMDNPINDYKIKLERLLKIERFIRLKKPYSPLSRLF